MAHIMICAIGIAAVVSLLIVSPHAAQRRARRALRAYGETEALPPAAVARTSQDRHLIFSQRIRWNSQFWRYTLSD
jgi:hypothetical protein